MLSITNHWGFPGGSVVKNPLANAGDMGLIPGSGTCPGGGNGNPLQYSCLGNPTNRRSLASLESSPWGCRRVGHNVATQQQQSLGKCKSKSQ